jgi:Domain of unknown function (DUF4387)
MAKVRDVCRHVRSKNAGPFWVTIDLFFDGHDNYLRYNQSEALGTAAIARLYGADPARVKRVPVESLAMVKISYPRTSPQGGIVERDMHSGQQFVRLLDVELD